MKVVEKMICQDILNELTELGYLNAGSGYFYRKINKAPIALLLFSNSEMKEKIKRLFVIYNRTLQSDPIPRGVSLTPQMIKYVLKNLPIYEVKLNKTTQEVK